jgi:phosphatidylserine/phosphatidylglycerophosphate/cardiolipin synthase-like enzyme
MFRSASRVVLLTLVILTAAAPTAQAAHRLCDPGLEDCRTILIDLIRQETVGIDVAFWFMEDPRFTTELIRRWQAGVPVRVLMDLRANDSTPLNIERLQELREAGIPMRDRYVGGILHWKMMLFAGQGNVEFSGANYSANAWAPMTETPLENFIDEVIFFTDKASIVNTFRTQFDNLWINTTSYRNHANITGPLAREYAIFPSDPELNFSPAVSYADRLVAAINAETVGIDIIMYRLTEPKLTSAVIAAHRRGIPVRLYTEQLQYRAPPEMSDRSWFMWDSAHVDILYTTGIQVKFRGHAGLNHEKAVLLRGQRMAVFGSSNWTEDSAVIQEEHNLFTRDAAIYDWLSAQFFRKWNNTGGLPETMAFTPAPPDRPVSPRPANGATSVSTAPGLVMGWNGGPWGQLYDIHIGLSPQTLTLVGPNVWLGPGSSQQITIPSALPPGTTIYWKIVTKTFALLASAGDVWSFTTAGTPTGPPPNGTAGPGDIVLYASEAAVRVGSWSVVPDATAAGGARLANANAGAPKLTTALAQPAHYVQLTFNAEAGKPYRLWIRGKAEGDEWANDSAFVQFSGSVTSTGTPMWRIGTTSATEYNLEDCSGCGLTGWGWQDNGWGGGVMGPLVYFATTGPQTIRVQVREDGLSIDQIILSQSVFLNASPGALRNDTMVYGKQ